MKGNYKCGHEGVDSEWGLENKVCPECFKKKRENEFDKALEEAKALGLPELTGTEKQIKYGIVKRARFIKHLTDLSNCSPESEAFSLLHTAQSRAGKVIVELPRELKILLNEIIHKETRAKYFIETDITEKEVDYVFSGVDYLKSSRITYSCMLMDAFRKLEKHLKDPRLEEMDIDAITKEAKAKGQYSLLLYINTSGGSAKLIQLIEWNGLKILRSRYKNSDGDKTLDKVRIYDETEIDLLKEDMEAYKKIAERFVSRYADKDFGYDLDMETFEKYCED